MINTKTTTLLVALIASLASTVAFADEGVAPAPVHKSENISQINGELVKVGDHNQYDYSYKKYNLAINPLTFVVGSISVQGSAALNSMVALRGDFTLYTGNEQGKGVELTASAAIYFRQMYSGLYLEPGVMYRNVKEESSESASTTVGVQTLIGYQWMWDSGLNASMAAGVGRDLNAEEDSFTDIYPNGYVRFGYAF